jgi:RNA polymerase sigma-70 factor (ECF subfamily)
MERRARAAFPIMLGTMSDRTGDVEAFRAALGATPAADAAFALDGWLRAKEAHPAVGVDAGGFAAHLAAILASGDVAAGELRVTELYVAFACCRGDAAAIGVLERLLAPVRGLLVGRGGDGAVVDDALQTVRYRLLVATPEREAKLATYRGRGSLAGWLRVVALRQLYALAPPRRERSDAALGALASAADPALAVLVQTHGPTVRRMFRDALAVLDERQRALLRMEILDALPHQQIADAHGVHRTTVVRWIEEARQLLAREVRRRLKRELDLADDSAESLLRTLAEHVELSLGSGLLPARAA